MGDQHNRSEYFSPKASSQVRPRLPPLRHFEAVLCTCAGLFQNLPNLIQTSDPNPSLLWCWPHRSAVQTPGDLRLQAQVVRVHLDSSRVWTLVRCVPRPHLNWHLKRSVMSMSSDGFTHQTRVERQLVQITLPSLAQDQFPREPSVRCHENGGRLTQTSHLPRVACTEDCHWDGAPLEPTRPPASLRTGSAPSA